MHIHFGMSGRFRVSPLPGPEATPTTRLQLSNEAQGIVANLSAMTVQHGDLGTFPALCSFIVGTASAKRTPKKDCPLAITKVEGVATSWWRTWLAYAPHFRQPSMVLFCESWSYLLELCITYPELLNLGDLRVQ